MNKQSKNQTDLSLLTSERVIFIRQRAERYSQEWKQRIGWIDETVKFVRKARQQYLNRE